MKEPTLFSDFLEALKVPHTLSYSSRAYRAMPFRSLFGLQKLLLAYGIESEGLQLADKSEITALPVPFLAKLPGGMVIVTDTAPDSIGYISRGVPQKVPAADFIGAWTGIAFMAYPDAKSIEPDYSRHRTFELLEQAKSVVLVLAAVFLLGYFFISNDLWRHPSAWLLVLFNLAGLFFTYHLVQKSANIRSATADRVCNTLQKGGCDSVLKSKASKFFGLFGWSEVGFAYFSVSLGAMLMFPQTLGNLALCNACCLPFTLWSIWYQKTRAKAWCTLCVSVQATLWCLFFCYLGGGWFRSEPVAGTSLLVLGAAYVAALLGLNKLMPLIEKNNTDNEDETLGAS